MDVGEIDLAGADLAVVVGPTASGKSDLALALETIKVNYAGYWAAEEGRRVSL